ncbi:MAG: hypothetical protein M4579_005558 [Chaenotheca gracillima]|nr:MAG: hypothetical protein M4579_005558 [Chaenotheca gracillima]
MGDSPSRAAGTEHASVAEKADVRKPRTSLTKLPLELLEWIMRYMSSPDLLSLCLASCTTYEVGLPILNRNVDVSNHNDKGLFRSYYPKIKVESENLDRALTDAERESLHRRQESLVERLLDHPERGADIRSLTWTLRTWDNIDEREYAEDPETEEDMWKAFQTMRNVQTVDIASVLYARELKAPPPLFASATSIRLLGQMSHVMARSILRSVDPSKLTTLVLDNVQDFGQKSEGVDLDASNPERKKESMYKGRPDCRFPGPMRSHLYPLVGKCTTLRHLSLHSIGQEAPWDSNRWGIEREVNRYKEWAAFINSVKPSLETLSLEQGVVPVRKDAGFCRTTDTRMKAGYPQNPPAPMDERFIQYILPVLKTGPWPKLEAMTLLGVWRSPTSEEDRHAAVAQLQNALGPHVLLKTAASASKTFYFPFHGHPYDD